MMCLFDAGTCLFGKVDGKGSLLIMTFPASWVRRAVMQPILLPSTHETSIGRFCGTHLPCPTARLLQHQSRGKKKNHTNRVCRVEQQWTEGITE